MNISVVMGEKPNMSFKQVLSVTPHDAHCSVWVSEQLAGGCCSLVLSTLATFLRTREVALVAAAHQLCEPLPVPSSVLFFPRARAFELVRGGKDELVTRGDLATRQNRLTQPGLNCLKQ